MTSTEVYATPFAFTPDPDRPLPVPALLVNRTNCHEEYLSVSAIKEEEDEYSGELEDVECFLRGPKI